MPRKKKADKKSEATDSHQVKIPDAVKKQAEKADALLAGDDPGNPEPGSEVVIIDNPSDDPVKEPDKPVFTPVDPEPKPDKTEPLPDDNVNWKHKYDVLQGMFNAKDGEVKALQQGMENLQNLVNHQAEQIRQINLSAQTPAAPGAPSTPSTPNAPDIKKIDLDSVAGYGDEIVYMAEGFNALVDMNQSLMAQLQQGPAQSNNVDPARFKRVESMVQETAQERYGKSLDAEVPKWREVINTPEFNGWLENIDPMSGYRYRDMMDYAYNNLRAPQAAAIIKAFGNSTGINVGTPKSVAPPTNRVGDTNIVDQTTDPLAGQAMPDETTGGDQGQTPQTYPTAEEVTQASALYAQGRISIEKFNEISNRFQQGLQAAKKAQGR
jgi:hypothetical protein